MEQNALITKHDNQITDVKDGLSQITIQLNVLLNDYKHLSEKVEQLLDVVKKLTDSNYKIKDVEVKVIALLGRIEKLEARQDVNVHNLEKLEIKTNRFSNLMQVIRQYWPLILAFLAFFGWLLDLVHKMDVAK